MLNNNHSAGSPDEWLRYARSDLEIARITPSQEFENQTEETCEAE